MQEDLTPYSAVCNNGYLLPWLYSTQGFSDSSYQVSSFNLPVHYDHTLITPVSMSQSLGSLSKPAYISSHDLEVKLSPSAMSPNFELFQVDEDQYSPNVRSGDSLPLRITTGGRHSPHHSPQPPTPYFGHFGVSSQMTDTVRSDTAPSIHQSPTRTHSSGMSNFGMIPRLPTPTILASNHRSPPPIRIAPTPPTLGPALQHRVRNNSVVSLPPLSGDSVSSTASSQLQSSRTQRPHANSFGYLPVRRKRKASSKDSDSDSGDILLTGDMNYEEHLLMQLTELNPRPWKEVAAEWKIKTGKDMKVPSLQMRKKRLIDRLRVWTPIDVLPFHPISHTHPQK